MGGPHVTILMLYLVRSVNIHAEEPLILNVVTLWENAESSIREGPPHPHAPEASSTFD